jgi:hypothetical protein
LERDYFKVPDDVLYHLAPEGLMVVHLELGEIYHFNEESKYFFEYFRTPRRLSEFLDAESSNRPTETAYLMNFCQSLLSAGLIRRETGAPVSDGIKIHYFRPILYGKASDELAPSNS